MPTREQLSIIWEAEMEFPEIRRDDDPMKPPTSSFSRKPFTGQVIGTIAVNPETGELRITPDDNVENQ